MAAIDFPSSPATNDVYTANGISFTWNGTSWISNTAASVTSASNVKILVKNSTGSTINKGSVVYVSGASGSNVLVSLAQANAESTSSQTLGFVESTLTNGASGYVIYTGTITGLNTAAYTEGDPVYLSGTTAGGYVVGLANKPSAPTHLVYLGTITRSQSVNGEIQVRVSNGWELNEIHDVQISSPANGQLLIRDQTSGVWKNATLTPGSNISITNAAGTVTIASTGGGGTPGGSAGQVQYQSTLGAFAGAQDVSIDNGSIILNAASVLGFSAPPSGYTALRAYLLGGSRPIMQTMDQYSYPVTMQPALFQNHIAFIKGIAGSTTVTSMGMALTAVGTATAATWATTRLHTSMNRLSNRVTTASTTSIAGFRGAAATYSIGPTSQGGFTYVIRFGLGTSTTTPNYVNCRGFVGLRASTATPTDVAISTLTNVLGIGWESADTNYWFYAGGATVTRSDTGIPVTRSAEVDVIEFTMQCYPDFSTVEMTAYEIVTGFSGAYQATTLPTNTTGLNPYGWVSAGGTSTTASFDLMSLYIESPN